MGHGAEVYFMNGMSELGGIGRVRGLDRNWGIAPGMVQLRQGWGGRRHPPSHPARRSSPPPSPDSPRSPRVPARPS
jgi:hypothetical protein